MGVQVTVAATQIDKQRLGYQAISLTNFTNSSEPSVTAGSKVEISGALYEFTGDETGTGWGGIGVGNVVYAYLVPSGSSLSWLYSTTAPTWSTSKQGWYNGDNRAFLVMYKTAAGYVNKKVLALPYENDISEEYDLIIDSNDKLDLWCQAVAGEYKRVLIKEGTWTASALSPTANVLINLTVAGTVKVVGEKGSVIAFSSASTFYAMYRSALLGDLSLESFDGVTLSITSTAAQATGFRNCRNLSNCKVTATAATGAKGYLTCEHLLGCIAVIGATSNGSAGGFDTCVHMERCTATATGSGTGDGSAFSNGSKASFCIGTGSGSAAANHNGTGFYGTDDLSHCIGSGTGYGTGYGMGFYTCNRIFACQGTGVNNSATIIGVGFRNCTTIVGCAGVGTNAGAAAGYGFIGGNKMQQNKALGASKTATYNTSYADAGAANACADTAAGGYNS